MFLKILFAKELKIQVVSEFGFYCIFLEKQLEKNGKMHFAKNIILKICIPIS